MQVADLDMTIRYLRVLDSDTLVREQSQELDEIRLVELWPVMQLLRESRLSSKDL